MTRERVPVVDADGHVCEPPDLWQRELPAAMRDLAIHVVWNPEVQHSQILVDGEVAIARGGAGLGMAGMSWTNFGEGRRYEEGNPAGFDPHERVKACDVEGIDVAVLFPGVGLKLASIADPALGTASCTIYNDWIAEFVSAEPERLAAVGVLPMQDPAAAAAEAARLKGLGLRAGVVRPNAYLGRPLHDAAFEPVYEALADAGLPLAIHPEGSGRNVPTSAFELMAATMALGTQHPCAPVFDAYAALTSLVFTGVLERHPTLTVAIMECGGGWIGSWMDRLDEFIEAYAWMLSPLSLKPSEYFLRQGYISFDPGERTMAGLLPMTGPSHFVWASDFPHIEAKYPGAVDEVMEHADDLPDDAREAYLGRNALELYGLPAPTLGP